MAKLRVKIDENSEPTVKTKRRPRFAPGGQSTQMIVGADRTSDDGILKTSARLYGSYRLRRVYYSAFSPIPDASAALPLQKPPLMREHRLYQADWLMRFYGFAQHEILAGSADGMLDLAIDPKLAWALHHRGLFPVDVNRAPKENLLRVPGLGTRAVKRILETRRFRRLGWRTSGGLRRRLPRSGHSSSPRAGRRAASTDAAGLKRPADTETGPTVAVLRPWPADAQLDLVRFTVALAGETDFAGWRDAARRLALAGVRPEDIGWRVGSELPSSGFARPRPRRGAQGDDASSSSAPKPCSAIPTPNASLFSTGCSGDCEASRNLLAIASDPDIRRFEAMEKAVRRDIHKMRAFVRFRKIGEAPNERYVAWFEPEHHIVERNAGSSSPLHRHALDHPDARMRRLTGTASACRSALERGARRRRLKTAPKRCGRPISAEHLQSGAAQGEGHAGGDAEEILAEPSRGFAHSRSDCRRGQAPPEI